MRKSFLLALAALTLASCGTLPTVSSSSKAMSSPTVSSSETVSSEPSATSEYVPTVREKVVSAMRDMASIRWTPSVDITYYSKEQGKVFRAGAEYVGLPYTMGGGRTTTLGSPLVKFKEKLDGQNVYRGPNGPDEYYGSDCSSSVEGAWRSVGIETGAIYTGAMIPVDNPKLRAVGDYDCSDRSKASESICAANGATKMHACYAALREGDALVRRVPTSSGYAGHVRLVASVDTTAQTARVIEQCGYGIDGQTKTTWRVDRDYTFAQLFNSNYIPISPFSAE